MAKTAAKPKNAKTNGESLEVTMDRRRKDRREQSDVDQRIADVPVTEEKRAEPRRKVARRRQIDPTTCERDYSNDEIEFMHALDAYKRTAGRMFPTCSEILEVIRDLGYRRLTPEELELVAPVQVMPMDAGSGDSDDDPESDIETDAESDRGTAMAFKSSSPFEAKFGADFDEDFDEEFDED